MVKEFKNTPPENMKATMFFKAELYSDLKEVVGILGIPMGTNPRKLNMANKISQFVEKNCPEGCCSSERD